MNETQSANGDGTDSRSRRRFLSTVGGVATITGLGGFGLGAYAGQAVFGSGTGDLAGTAGGNGDEVTFEYLEVHGDIRVHQGGTAIVPAERRDEYNIVILGAREAEYDIDMTVRYVDEHQEYGSRRETTIEAGSVKGLSLAGSSRTATGDNIDTITLEVVTSASESPPRLEVDIGGDLNIALYDLAFSGTDTEPAVGVGEWEPVSFDMEASAPDSAFANDPSA